MKLSTHVKIDFEKSARSVDANGFMHVEGVPLFRSGILEIPGIELQAWVPDKLDYSKKYRLRVEQSVLDANISTFAHKPVTWGHKWIGGNSKNDFIGFTGDTPFINGDLACDNITLADGDAVYRISTKEREELSAGISGEIERSSVGYADYDLLSFECNHVAVVKRGKAGHRVRILNEMFESGEIEGKFLMEEENQTQEKEVKNDETETEVKEETAKADEGTEKTEPVAEEKRESEEGSGEKVQEEPKADDSKGDAPSGDSRGEIYNAPKNEESSEKTETESVKVEEPTVKQEPEKKEEQTSAWSYNVTEVVHSDSPKDPSISGHTVELHFEEGGVYEYKNGKIARIQLEEMIEECVEQRSNDIVEAFSICKKVNSGVELSNNIDSMYRSTAKLVFGSGCDGCDRESLKRMLQGYLFGRSANLSSGCVEKKDIRTIEVNI